MQTERLAVLALASQVASGPPIQAGADPIRGTPWTAQAQPLEVKASRGHADAASITQMFALSPGLVPMTTENKSSGSREVLGAAFPGLLFCNAASEILQKYSSLRDSVCTTVLQARISDAAFAGMTVMLAAALI